MLAFEAVKERNNVAEDGTGVKEDKVKKVSLVVLKRKTQEEDGFKWRGYREREKGEPGLWGQGGIRCNWDLGVTAWKPTTGGLVQ